jgi:hypothetical protein
MAKMLPDQERIEKKQEFSGGNIKKIFIFSVGHLLDRGGYNDRDRSGNRKRPSEASRQSVTLV